jgi:hypothetical protein
LYMVIQKAAANSRRSRTTDDGISGPERGRSDRPLPRVVPTLPRATMSGERFMISLSKRRQPLAQPAPKLARVSRGAPSASDVGSETAGRRREVVCRPRSSSSGGRPSVRFSRVREREGCWPDVTPLDLACSGGSPVQGRRRIRRGTPSRWSPGFPRNRQRQPRRRWPRAR